MDLRQLRYFVGVVDSGSISRAATVLNVAQSALSQHVARLEIELETKLLTRGPAGVAPTDSGKILYAHARLILRHVEIVRDDCCSRSNEPIGDVSVGFPAVLSPLLSYRLFNRVRKTYPGIRLKLVDASSRHLREFIENGRLDIALLFVGQSEQRFRADVLVEEELFYVSADRDRTSVTLDELSSLDLLLPNRDSSITAVLRSEMAALGRPLSSLGEVDSISTLLQAAADGVAGTILPWAALYNEGLADLLCYTKFVDVQLVRPIALCTPCALAESLAVSAVSSVLSKLARDLVHSGRWKGAVVRRDYLKGVETPIATGISFAIPPSTKDRAPA